MDDRLLEVSAEVFERLAWRYVDHLFDVYATLPGADHFLSAPFLEVPFIGSKYWAGQETPELRQEVVRALGSAWKSYQEGPDWGIRLPIRLEQCNALTNVDDVKFNLVGYFGRSLCYADWDQQHPGFHTYSCSLMAHELAPDDIRNDAGLQEEFPPRPLVDLDRHLSWSSPEYLALVRQAEAMRVAYESGTFFPSHPG